MDIAIVIAVVIVSGVLLCGYVWGRRIRRRKGITRPLNKISWSEFLNLIRKE
jgi:hypothetical protein